MKAKPVFLGLTYTLALGLLTTQTTIAQTPDGQTPVNEGICDPLRSPGVTKGLYGLCVAFCEAQDWANQNTPITAEGLIALESQPPSGKILENYNKRKSTSDPAMPCVVVEEPCPCWTTQELASIDGVIDNTSYNLFCNTLTTPPTHLAYTWEYTSSTPVAQRPYQVAFASSHDGSSGQGFADCHYLNMQQTPPLERLIYFPDTNDATFIACANQINAQCEAASP